MHLSLVHFDVYTPWISSSCYSPLVRLDSDGSVYRQPVIVRLCIRYVRSNYEVVAANPYFSDGAFQPSGLDHKGTPVFSFSGFPVLPAPVDPVLLHKSLFAEIYSHDCRLWNKGLMYPLELFKLCENVATHN